MPENVGEYSLTNISKYYLATGVNMLVGWYGVEVVGRAGIWLGCGQTM